MVIRIRRGVHIGIQKVRISNSDNSDWISFRKTTLSDHDVVETNWNEDIDYDRLVVQKG